MEKVYLVFEGEYVDDYGEVNFSEVLTKVYPTEDMAQHYLELWFSKTLKEIDERNRDEEKDTAETNECLKEMPNFVPMKPVYWTPNPENKKERKSFTRYDDEIFCRYEEKEVSREVKLE